MLAQTFWQVEEALLYVCQGDCETQWGTVLKASSGLSECQKVLSYETMVNENKI